MFVFFIFLLDAPKFCAVPKIAAAAGTRQKDQALLSRSYIGNTAQAIENQEEKWYNIVMNKQLTFSLISDEPAQTKTSKKEFLEKIERIIPFDEWIRTADLYII